jgi:small-conductance mechanosensitive channel
MEFLSNLLIVILVIWAVGWILRLLFRRWLVSKVGEFQRAAGQAQREARRQARRGKEGDVTVENDGAVAAGQKVQKDVGEYVEFEEIVVEESEQAAEREQ